MIRFKRGTGRKEPRSFTLSLETWARLEQFCRERGIGKSELVETAILALLDQVEHPEAQGGIQPEFLDAAALRDAANMLLSLAAIAEAAQETGGGA